MDKDQIKRVYLEVLGNPSVGVFAEHADIIAQAIADALNPPEVKKVDSEKEIRLVKPEETRQFVNKEQPAHGEVCGLFFIVQ